MEGYNNIYLKYDIKVLYKKNMIILSPILRGNILVILLEILFYKTTGLIPSTYGLFR